MTAVPAGDLASRHAELDAENVRVMAALERPYTHLDSLVGAVDRLGELVTQRAAGGTVPQGLSFATSGFKRLYDVQARPSQQYELFQKLHLFLKSYAALKGRPESAADSMFEELQKEAFTCKERESLLGEVEKIAVVLWTSAANIGFDKEFCSILNEIVREDTGEVLPHAVFLCRAMASLVVTRRKDVAALSWPEDLVSHRGTNMPREAVDFFSLGLVYRAPMFLATSFLESKANDFLRNTPPDRVAVHFKFRLDPIKKCDHAMYIEGISLIEGEHELLYAPYSAFRVSQVIIPVGQFTWDNPIVIELFVEPNNRSVPEDVPLSSWH